MRFIRATIVPEAALTIRIIRTTPIAIAVISTGPRVKRITISPARVITPCTVFAISVIIATIADWFWTAKIALSFRSR